jgi:uncharacterized membrane protein YdfJ with MMPL/SSD domain
VIVQKPALGSQRGSLVALESQLGRQPGVAGVFGPREQLFGGVALGAAGLSTAGATVAKEAVPRATRAISVAALALALSFALLGVVDLQSFHQLALLLFVGVLIDSFFVCSLLVPALVTVFGRTSAWPGRLRRREDEAESGAARDPRR